MPLRGIPPSSQLPVRYLHSTDSRIDAQVPETADGGISPQTVKAEIDKIVPKLRRAFGGGAYANLLKEISKALWLNYRSDDTSGEESPRIHVFNQGRMTFVFSQELDTNEMRLLNEGKGKLKKIKKEEVEKTANIAEGTYGVVYKSIDIMRLMSGLSTVSMKSKPADIKNQVKQALRNAVVAEKEAKEGQEVSVPIEVQNKLKGSDTVILPLDQTESRILFDLAVCDLTRVDLEAEQAKLTVASLADNLDSIHQKGVVLVDIKLQNVVFTEKGNYEKVAFIDLDDAEVADEYNEKLINREADPMGSPVSVAPEIAMIRMKKKEALVHPAQQNPGQKADIFSLGIAACELFKISPTHAIINVPPHGWICPDTRDVIPKIKQHPQLTHKQKNMLIRMINYHPENRPSLQEVKQAFQLAPPPEEPNIRNRITIIE